MEHTYKITGMTCIGCQTNVERALNDIQDITSVKVDLAKSEVRINMRTHISDEELQAALIKAGLHYSIEMLGSEKPCHNKQEHHHETPINGNGTYYCPMHCEGEKTYDRPGDCPVCGMHLVEQPRVVSEQQFTCPMPPECIKRSPWCLAHMP